MAVNVHKGLGDSSAGFALSYVAVRLILVCQYFRAAKHIASAQRLATHYAIGFALAAAFWFLSAWVPLPWRFVLWGVGLLIDLMTPLTAFQVQARLMPHFEHLPERFGLFIIIVLGEAIIAVVNGVAEQQWQVFSVLTAALGFTIAFCLWWIYFENVGGTALRMARAESRVSTLQIWLFGHLPLVLGIAAAGVAVEHCIMTEPNLTLPNAVRWLLCGSVAMCLLSLAILHRTGVIFRCKVRAKYRLWSAIALLGVAAFGVGLLPLVVVAIVAGIAGGQVVQDLYQGHPAPQVTGGH